jgi:hypothetical protein
VFVLVGDGAVGDAVFFDSVSGGDNTDGNIVVLLCRWIVMTMVFGLTFVLVLFGVLPLAAQYSITHCVASFDCAVYCGQ